MFVILISSKEHHNKSYDYENNNKYMQKPKIQKKSARGKCQSHLNHKRFSENFIYDTLNVFWSQWELTIFVIFG